MSRPALPRSPAAARPAERGAGWLAAVRRYLATTALGHLAWEFGHMPLYTLWTEGTWREIAFAAVHCTGGDVLIALAALTSALLLAGRSAWPAKRAGAVAALTLAFGLGYTIFSEWLNVVQRAAWTYSAWMPVVPLGGFDLGVSPLAQWLVVPALALWLAQRPAVPGPRRGVR